MKKCTVIKRQRFHPSGQYAPTYLHHPLRAERGAVLSDHHNHLGTLEGGGVPKVAWRSLQRPRPVYKLHPPAWAARWSLLALPTTQRFAWMGGGEGVGDRFMLLEMIRIASPSLFLCVVKMRKFGIFSNFSHFLEKCLYDRPSTYW
jgi:hypothetical protein